MKFQLAGLVALSAFAQASPVDLEFPSISLLNSTLNHTNGTAGWNNGSNHSNASNASNSTNGTVPVVVKDKLKVIITGGDYKIQNSTLVDYEFCFNASTALNFTQINEVAEIVNKTVSDETYKGVVIVGNGNSVESLGFYNSIVIDSKKPVVVAQNDTYGLLIANNTFAHGSLVVSDDYFVYSGVFSPVITKLGTSLTSGVPVAACGDDLSVNWFFGDYTPALIEPYSPIRTNFTDFSSLESTIDGRTPVVPIISEIDCSATLLESLSSVVDGLVIVSTEGNESKLDLSSIDFPIVYAKGQDNIPFLSDKYIPEGACAAGYLSPVKAQLLLTISLIHGATAAQYLEIFP